MRLIRMIFATIRMGNEAEAKTVLIVMGNRARMLEVASTKLSLS